MPCRRDEDLRRPGVRLLRLRELEGDDGLLLGEVPDPHTRREVAINGLDAELVIPICEDEPILTGELDRLLLSERSLIAADLLVVDELGDDHVVALDVGDGVLLGEAARLLAEVFVLPRDSRSRVRPLKGEAAVGCAALPIGGGDDEVVDRIEAQGVELFRGDRDRELLSLRGVVDGAERFVVQHLDDRHGVPVRVVDGVVVGEADVLVPEVGVRAGDGRGGVDAVESPRPSRRPALSVSDDDLDRVGAEGQFADVDRDRVFEISRRGERLRRSPINRLRRRQDVAGVGVVDGVLDREVLVLISEVAVTVRDQRVSVQDFKDGAETDGHVPSAGRVDVPVTGRRVPTVRAVRRVLRPGLLTPGIHAHPMPKLIMGTVVIGRVEVGVQVRGNRGRESGDDFLAGDEPVPLVIGRCSSGIPVVIPPVAASGEEAALVLCPVDGDGLAGDIALPVQVIPRDADQNDAVANEEGFVPVLDLDPLELVRVRAGSVSEGVVRHAAGHLRDVSVAAVPTCGVVRPPRLCGPLENCAVVVESAELDGSEILRHKGSLLPF